jgi:transmembrane sensor
MAASPHDYSEPDRIAQAAAAWLARRDRELSPAEQDEYLQWLRQDPRHGQAIAHLQNNWRALDALARWRPAHSAHPNPDLLARPGRHPLLRWRNAGLALTAAAAVAGGMLFFAARPVRDEETPPARAMRVIPGPERLTLADGSVVELDRDGRIETDFTPAERRVRLVRGVAHFTVAKNPARPFIVDAGAVAVRAVGTVFEVRRAATAVEVLVTEGKVRVERPTPAGTVGAPPTSLVAGERAVVDTTAHAGAPVVTAVSAAEIERALAWQGVRLEFPALPLAEVVPEFNLRNTTKILIGDQETAGLRIGGTVRADNVEGFVRLLQMSFGVTAEYRPDGTVVLRHAR